MSRSCPTGTAKVTDTPNQFTAKIETPRKRPVNTARQGSRSQSGRALLACQNSLRKHMSISQQDVQHMLQTGRGTIHNARLVSVSHNDAREAVFDVEGVTVTALVSHIDSHSIGEVGMLWHPQPSRLEDAGMVSFRAYPDQSLRRCPHYDSSAPHPCGEFGMLGWSCDAIGMFQAPSHVIPGERGSYVRDRTTPLQLAIPPEFANTCAEVGMSVDRVLRAFMADAAGIMNYLRNPRADGFSSNGSDERDMAKAYIERTWGHNREWAAQNRYEREQAEERHEQQESIFDEVQDILDGCGLELQSLPDIVRNHLPS